MEDENFQDKIGTATVVVQVNDVFDFFFTQRFLMSIGLCGFEFVSNCKFTKDLPANICPYFFCICEILKVLG